VYARLRAVLESVFDGASQTSDTGNALVDPHPSLNFTRCLAASNATTLQVHGPHIGQLHTTRWPGTNAQGRSSAGVRTSSLPRRNRTRTPSSDVERTSAT